MSFTHCSEVQYVAIITHQIVQSRNDLAEIGFDGEVELVSRVGMRIQSSGSLSFRVLGMRAIQVMQGSTVDLVGIILLSWSMEGRLC